jgi:hypothetical protein
MKKSLVALTLLLGLSAGAAVAAPANQTAAAPQQFSDQPQGTPGEDEALKAYENNTNPNVSVPTTGPYDERDRYTGPNGYQLPGYGRLPPS